MNDTMNEKLRYDTPAAQIMIFPEQDILTNSGSAELPLDDEDWE